MNQSSRKILNFMLDTQGFNNMRPAAIAHELEKVSKHWVDVLWFENHEDTVLVIPKSDGESQARCELVGHRTDADEVDFMTAERALDLLKMGYGGHLDNIQLKLVNRKLKGVTSVLRLWWD